MLLMELPGNDRVFRYMRSAVIFFGGKRKVLSTAPLNGGYREDLKYVFNHDEKTPGKPPHYMKAPTYEGHMALTAEEIGLDPKYAACISTAAGMENMAARQEVFRGLTVTALATAGIDVNGGRAGDPADWYEENGEFTSALEPGTINIMLHFNADLTEGAMARALVTCTEAKTAAIQELQLPSRYSRGLATGSGTDGTIIIADPGSPHKITYAGKHSKLGELIGLAVKAALREAFARQCNATPQRQHDAVRRTERFGATENALWERYRSGNPNGMSRADFAGRLREVARRGMTVAYASLYAHLMDQADWGMLSCKEAAAAGKNILKLMGMESGAEITASAPDDCIKKMTEEFIKGLLSRIASCGPVRRTAGQRGHGG